MEIKVDSLGSNCCKLIQKLIKLADAEKNTFLSSSEAQLSPSLSS